MDFQHLADVHTTRHTVGVQNNVHRSAVRQERHVFLRQDLTHNALVAVAAGQLIAVLDLALLGNVHTNHFVDAGGQVVVILPGESTNANDLAGFTVRHLHGGVANLAGLLAEDGAQQALLRGQLGLALRGDLTHQDVAVADVGTDADNTAVIQVLQHVLGHVRDFTGNFLGTELGVAGVNFVFLNVDRGENVLLHKALIQNDRVLVVVAFPWHERHQQVAAECHFTVVGAGAVGNNLTSFNAVANVHQWLLVVARTLVGALEFAQDVGVADAVVTHHGDEVRRQVLHHAGFLGNNQVACVVGGAQLHAGTHVGGFRADQRHSLTLHVRTHEGTVSVVVLQEGNHGGSHGHHLTWGNIHVVDVGGVDHLNVPTFHADHNTLFGDVAVLIKRRVRLGDHVAVFLICGEVVNLIRQLAVHNLAVGGFNEAEGVDLRVGGQ